MMPDFILPKAMQQLADSIRGKTLHRQIQRVQVFFHHHYGYFIGPDKRVILTPTELDAAGKGDCKAHAVSKYLVLLRAGVPMASMRLVLTRNEQRVAHMIVFVGDRVLDLQAHVYAPPTVPYIPLFGWNHESHGFCENAFEAWLGWCKRTEVIWDFTYITWDDRIWRFVHSYKFRFWTRFNKKLEAEMQSEFAKSLQMTPFERAVAESGVEADKRGVSPETEAELMQLVAQAGVQVSPALFGKMSARAKQEVTVFVQNNQSSLRAICLKMGVKL